MEKRKDYKYIEIAIKNLEDKYKLYSEKKCSLDELSFSLVSLINVVGPAIDKDKLEDEVSLALRFLWNVSKHDKSNIKLGLPCYEVYPVCGAFICGESLSVTNSISKPILILNNLQNNTLYNQNGSLEYERIIKDSDIEKFIRVVRENYIMNEKEI